MPLYLAAADVGVVPNRSQPAISARYTSPLKVFETMAVGLPLVASDLPSLREVLGDDEAVLRRARRRRRAGRGPARAARRRRAPARAWRGACARAPREHTWDARARSACWTWMRARARAMRGAMRGALFLTDSLSRPRRRRALRVRLIAALERLEPGLEVEVLLARKHRPTSADVPAHWRVDVALPPDYFFYM